MDVQAGRAGRMRAGEFLDDDALGRRRRDARARAPCRRRSCRRRAARRATSPASKSASRPASTTSTGGACGCVSIAVTKIACGVADGAGTRENGRVRNAVHRPDSTSSARTASASSPSGGAAAVARERDLRIRAVRRIDVDDERLERAHLAAVDRRDGAGGRRGVADAGRLLVLEQRRARAARGRPRCTSIVGFRPEVVGAEERHPRGRRRDVDDLRRLAGQRQIETFPKLVHGHFARASRRAASVTPRLAAGHAGRACAGGVSIGPAG